MPQDHLIADDTIVDVIRNHLLAKLAQTPLEADPFCHVYMEGVFPADIYWKALQLLPEPRLYVPLNLRKWVRADGTSTRDQFYLAESNLARLPSEQAAFWGALKQATSSRAVKRAVFQKMAPDLALRFGIPEAEVSDIECVCEALLVRDTEDYRIKPHPDGLNKIVTMQCYLPADASTVDLGTSLFVRHRRLIGSRFEEVKKFPFKPNSGYAFAVSELPGRTSWHGRERLSGFTGVRNTLMVLFQKVPSYTGHKR